jgi:DNA gyrase/topoisomerase IV subunit A
MKHTEKTISDFLSNDYKEFAFYTIENRAIPSIIDGFKPSQRKIIHISNLTWRSGNEKSLKIFQLAGKVASDCLEYNTEILLPNDETIKIGEWFHLYPDVELEVLCLNENGEVCISKGFNPKISLQKDVYEIETEDGKIHKMSGNHLVMLKDGSYKKASDLTEDDELKSITNEYFKFKIKKIELEVPESYYDISVEKHNNFIINNSIVVHNCFYHHGSSSLENAIITMAQKFKNNAPLLEEEGQFGTLRQPEASAPRYIGTKLSPNFRLIYKDFELLNYKEEEGERIEPEYFLPIIPMVLVNGSSGIAVGFSSNILNRNILEVIDSCELLLKNKKIKSISPTIFSFFGDFIQDSDNHKRWIIRGKFTRVNTTTIRVTDLPISMTYEKYENLLDSLTESGKIQSYDDNCKENIDYVVKFKRGELEKLKDEDIIKLLKLEEYSTEIFNTLDETGKLKQFESDVEIVKYFVDFRLSWYQKRKDYLLDKMRRELLIMSNRVRFIKSIIDKKLEVRNKPKLEIISNLEKDKFDKIDGDYDYLLRMAIWSLTKEMYEKLLKEIESKKLEIEALEKKEPRSIYLEDLKELKSKIKKN